MAGYYDYYKRAIEQHETGLKLVVGGTGLGKISNIKGIVRDLPTSKVPSGVSVCHFYPFVAPLAA